MYNYRTKDEVLQQVKTSIGNIEANAPIAAKLMAFGVGEASLSTGKTLVQMATLTIQKQLIEEGEQHAATARCNELFDMAETKFKVTYKIARLSITEPGIFNQLGIDSLDRVTFDKWAQGRLNFYTNALALPVVLEKLAKYNIKKEDLEAGKQLVEDTITANLVQLKETGESRMATADRDDAFTHLRSWYAELRTVAKLALEKRELEIIGM